MKNEMDQATSETPLACTLTKAEKAARKEDFQGLFEQVEQALELADGYALRFPGEASLGARLLEFIGAERACCPFVRFELAFEPNQGPIWLHLRETTVGKEIIVATFSGALEIAGVRRLLA